MKYNRLGKTNLMVSGVGFGTAQIGGPSLIKGKPFGSKSISDKEAYEILSLAKEAGINFFDSSDMYGDGLAEKRLGVFFSGSHDVVIATKCGFDKNVYVCSHDMLNRYFFDILGDTDGDQELLIFVNSSNYSLSKEKLDKLRNDCIASDNKHSLKTVKRRLRHIGVTDEEINRIKLPGFLPQGNQEASQKIIPLTNQQMLV